VAVAVSLFLQSREFHLARAQVRHDFAQMFQGEVGRAYWAGVRQGWLDTAMSRNAKSFVRIADEEYDRARASGPAQVPPGLVVTHGKHDRHAFWCSPNIRRTGVLAGVGIGVVAAVVARVSQRRGGAA
jgi:Family of unknown function (DUF6082)